MRLIGLCLALSFLSGAAIGATETVYNSVGDDGRIGSLGVFDGVRLVGVTSDKRPDGYFKGFNYYSTELEPLSVESDLSHIRGDLNVSTGYTSGRYLRDPLYGGYYLSSSSFYYGHHDEIVFNSVELNPLVEFRFSMRPSGVLNENVNTRVSSSLSLGSAASFGVSNPAEARDGSIHLDLSWQNGVVSGQAYNSFTFEYYNYLNLAVCGDGGSGACLSANDPFEIIYITRVPANIELGLNFSHYGSTSVSMVGRRDEFGNGGVTSSSSFSFNSALELQSVSLESRSGLTYVTPAVPEPSRLAILFAGLGLVLGCARTRTRRNVFAMSRI